MNTRGKIMVVLFFLSVCASATLINYRLRLHREAVRPADLYDVVYRQLTEFRNADYSHAYLKASNGIRQKFKPEQFESMIRRDYSDAVNAERIEFGAVRCRDQHAVIQVFFIGHDGAVQPCIYSLLYEGETWKIDGARMLPRWPTGSRLGGLEI